MKKILLIFVSTFVLNACSSSDEKTTPKDESGFATTPVSGKIYDSNFTYAGGYATSSISNGVDKLFINLSASAIDCDCTCDCTCTCARTCACTCTCTCT
jgi:hypothetical protein